MVDHALYTGEIHCLARRTLDDHGVRFLGVFPVDLAPRNLEHETRAPYAFIMNTDPGRLPGKHWLAFYRSSNTALSPLEFFDSYGLPPHVYSLTHLYPRIVHNPITLQSDDSFVCGQYALTFLHLRAIGHNFSEIPRFLLSFSIHPDKVVSSYVNDLQARYRLIDPCITSSACHGQYCKPRCFACL